LIFLGQTVLVCQSYNAGLPLWPKNIKIETTVKTNLQLGCPWGKLKQTKNNFKVNYPFKSFLQSIQATQLWKVKLH